MFAAGGQGFNSSGNNNNNPNHPDGFGRGGWIGGYRFNQEQCVLCNQVFYDLEDLINHYDVHIRGNDTVLSIFQNSLHRMNQARTWNTVATLPSSFSAPPAPPIAAAIRTSATYQSAVIQPPGVNIGPVRRGRQNNNNNNNNLAPRANIARARANAGVAQRRQQAAAAAAARNVPAAVPLPVPAAVPDVINLEFGDDGSNSDGNNTTEDGAVNLDLTLGHRGA